MLPPAMVDTELNPLLALASLISLSPLDLKYFRDELISLVFEWYSRDMPV